MTAQQLKNAILQLAVQGKLVPQDPSDEPASVLLERIRAEKEALIKAKKIKREKNPSVIFRGADNIPYENTDNEPPFEIPYSWVWVSHNELFEVSGGSQPPKSKFSETPKPGYIRLYQIRDYGPNPVPVYIPENMASKTTVKGDILLARYGASLGKVFFAEDGAYNVAMAKVIKLYSSALIDDLYLYYYYQSDIYQSLVKGNSRSAQAGFNKEDLDGLWFPLPPLAEQKRIVAAIENMLPYCVAYQEKHSELESLNAAFPIELKKSILQWAVQGRLVPQDENDEPADILLERIRAEKEALIKAGKIKRDKHESVIFRRDNSHYEKLDGIECCIDDEIPFEVPASWGWIRLGGIGEWGSGATPSRGNPEYYNGDIPWLKTGDLTDGYITEIPESISEEALNNTSVKLNPSGSILMAMYGATIGKLGILTYPATTNQACCACKPVQGIEPLYLFYFLMSQRKAFIKRGEGGAQPNISKEKIVATLMPVPPLAEQQRIVAKIEELMPLVKTV